MDVLITFKYEEDPIENEGARVLTTFSPLYPYGSYPLPWTPEFRSDLAQNLMQPFPHPNDGSGCGDIQVKKCLQTHRHTARHKARQTTARLVYYKLTFQPSAQVS